MTWWNSFEILSKLQTALTILISLLSVATLTIKLRGDHLKKQIDSRRSEERRLLDRRLEDKTTTALRTAAALEARQAPRSISDEHLKRLVADLRGAPPPPKVLVIYPHGDEEARLFAQELVAALTEARIKVESTWWLGSPVPSGISVLSKTKISDPSAFSLSRALASAAVKNQYMRGTLVPDSDIQIIVGSKP